MAAREFLRASWCCFWHRDQWLGFGEGDWWHLECPECAVKWISPRTGKDPGRVKARSTLSQQEGK